jgi:hypothetical protein
MLKREPSATSCKSDRDARVLRFLLQFEYQGQELRESKIFVKCVGSGRNYGNKGPTAIGIGGNS